MAIISKGGRKNPFVVPPTYHNWAPWIGPQTRQSNVVLNTEFEKVQEPKKPSSGDPDDQQITEERLTDELLNLKVNSICEMTWLNTFQACLTLAAWT